MEMQRARAIFRESAFAGSKVASLELRNALDPIFVMKFRETQGRTNNLDLYKNDSSEKLSGYYFTGRTESMTDRAV